jgi:hypothetical protein
VVADIPAGGHGGLDGVVVEPQMGGTPIDVAELARGIPCGRNSGLPGGAGRIFPRAVLGEGPPSCGRAIEGHSGTIRWIRAGGAR